MSDKKTFERPHVDSNTVAVLSQKLLEANNELKKAEEDRKNMLENISHDLRTPLTAIRSTIDYLTQRISCDDNKISQDELSSYLKILDNRAKTLEVLVQDLFLLTCLDSGREELHFEKVPVVQFLEEFFFAVEIDEKFSDNTLILDVDEKIDAIIYADVGKMSRVLDNLFSNARKYSDVGSTITLGCYTVKDFAYIYVKDNGYGIPKEDIPYIFNRTYRVSQARTPEKETSNGLGLSIVQSIVMHHKGEITCNSKEGEGSIFTIKLPLTEI
jgi:signal transduction histidine kinase